MAVRKVTRERVSLHLPSEGMAREACGMRHVWVGVMEGASRDHHNIPQSLLNVRVILSFPSSQGHLTTSNFILWQGYLLAHRPEHQDEPLY